jgi:predicted nucleic acid-binding protein
MNIVDSSLWLEFLAGTENGNIIAEVIQETGNLIIPTITIYEVFKKLLLERNEDDALFTVAQYETGENNPFK